MFSKVIIFNKIVRLKRTVYSRNTTIGYRKQFYHNTRNCSIQTQRQKRRILFQPFTTSQRLFTNNLATNTQDTRNKHF